MNFIISYLEAFSRCYPQTNVGIIRARHQGAGSTPRWHVVINGDKGNITLSEDDFKSATREFNK